MYVKRFVTQDISILQQEQIFLKEREKLDQYRFMEILNSSKR